MIKKDTIALLTIYVIFSIVCISSLLFFADQVHQDIITDRQYIGYDSNTIDYIISESNSNYYGFVLFESLYSSNNCSLFVYSDNLLEKVEGYLQFNYPLYVSRYVYYNKNNDCVLTISNLLGDTILTIIFAFLSAIFIYGVICYSINLHEQRKSDVQIIDV